MTEKFRWEKKEGEYEPKISTRNIFLTKQLMLWKKNVFSVESSKGRKRIINNCHFPFTIFYFCKFYPSDSNLIEYGVAPLITNEIYHVKCNYLQLITFCFRFLQCGLEDGFSTMFLALILASTPTTQGGASEVTHFLSLMFSASLRTGFKYLYFHCIEPIDKLVRCLSTKVAIHPAFNENGICDFR